MGAGGRPPKEFDKQQFEMLCSLQCTEEEICAVLFTTDKTLTNWCQRTYGMCFSEIYKQKRQLGKISLRRSLFRLKETNAAVAIFMAKNLLGYTDKMEETVRTDEPPNITLNLVPSKGADDETKSDV